MRKDNTNKISRRKYIGTAGSAFLLANTSTTSAKETPDEKSKGEEYQHHTNGRPYSVSITNNSTEKKRLKFILKDEDDNITFRQPVVLPGLNDPTIDSVNKVRRRLTLDLKPGTVYKAQLIDGKGNAVESDYRIPDKMPEAVSLSASVGPRDDLMMYQTVK